MLRPNVRAGKRTYGQREDTDSDGDAFITHPCKEKTTATPVRKRPLHTARPKPPLAAVDKSQPGKTAPFSLVI